LGSNEALTQQNKYLKNKLGKGDTGVVPDKKGDSNDLLGAARKIIKKNPLTAVAGAGAVTSMTSNGGSPVVVNN
jgi:hypothetical protein